MQLRFMCCCRYDVSNGTKILNAGEWVGSIIFGMLPSIRTKPAPAKRLRLYCEHVTFKMYHILIRRSNVLLLNVEVFLDRKILKKCHYFYHIQIYCREANKIYCRIVNI